MKRGDTGLAVCDLQVRLMQLGYHLPRYGADGKLGTETLEALGLFLRAHAAERDIELDDVSPEELEIVNRVWGSTVGGLLMPPIGQFHDIRGIATHKADGGPRTWKDVTGITLHQTACNLGERIERWATVGAHVGVTRAGKVIHMHDFDRAIWHGNGWNQHCVGIEMDGLYPGLEDDPSTIPNEGLMTTWDDPSTRAREVGQTPTRDLILSARAAVRWICKEVERHGGRVTKLVAHRQSSESRRNDPGSALWQAVGLSMQAELGLDDGGPGFRIGTGYPIPEAWDSTRIGIEY